MAASLGGKRRRKTGAAVLPGCPHGFIRVQFQSYVEVAYIKPKII
jgi:hypothetical protein